MLHDWQTITRCTNKTQALESSSWGRVFAQAGHEIRILPAQFVKPYLKANKNDFNDAEAIVEAGARAQMRAVSGTSLSARRSCGAE